MKALQERGRDAMNVRPHDNGKELPMPLKRTTDDPFWEAVDVRGPAECWPWLRGRSMGYGIAWRDSTVIRTHRLAYTLTSGAIPDRLFVCHTCDNKVCVNPAHLFIGTHRDNMVDKCRKGRDHESRKTHCPQGHPYDEDNTHHQPGTGWRICRKCRRVNQRASRERLRARGARAWQLR